MRAGPIPYPDPAWKTAAWIASARGHDVPRAYPRSMDGGNGLFYLATLEFLLAVAGAAVAASTDDMLWRPVGAIALAAGFVLLVRTLRHVLEAER